MNLIKFTKLTSFVLRLGVDRDELEPERDGGLSVGGLTPLLPGLSNRSPFKLSRSRPSMDKCSPFGRGECDSFYSNKKIYKLITIFGDLINCLINNNTNNNLFNCV